MGNSPEMKFGGSALQGTERFGPHEDMLLEEVRRLDGVNDIYRLLAWRRNNARAQRLAQVARDFVLPARAEGGVPVVVVSAFDWATDKLEQLAAVISSNPKPREFARLLMSGELRANTSLAMTLEAMGCAAESMTGREAGIVTKGGPTGALIDHVQPKHLLSLIEEEIVPVVAGFQGYYRDVERSRDEVSILGRGGSNLTAVALADAIEETECTMFSDVRGLFDRDPRKDPKASQLDAVDAQELFKWDPFPQVIQREAVEYACERGVDIWIRSAFEPKVAGTLIKCR